LIVVSTNPVQFPGPPEIVIPVYKSSGLSGVFLMKMHGGSGVVIADGNVT